MDDQITKQVESDNAMAEIYKDCFEEDTSKTIEDLFAEYYINLKAQKDKIIAQQAEELIAKEHEKDYNEEYTKEYYVEEPYMYNNDDAPLVSNVHDLIKEEEVEDDEEYDYVDEPMIT